MTWTPKRIAEVKRLYVDEGKSLTECGEALKEKRGAISGIVNRHGFQRRGSKQSSHKPAPKVAARPTPKAAPAAPPIRCLGVTPPAVIVAEPAPPGGVVLLNLRPLSCRWPLGDARKEADGLQRFCGKARDAEAHGARGSYCCAHGKMAVQAVQPSKRIRVYEPGVVRSRAAA